MLRSLILGAAAALALGATAQAQTAKDFVAKAGASDKFEIASAKMAETKSHDPAVRKFAAKMIQDHTRSTMKVKAAARRAMGRSPPPPVLSSDQEEMLSSLRRAGGRDFDRTYLDQQTQAHQQALDLMQGYAQAGDAPPLKHAAGEIAPVVQMHMDMLKSLKSHSM